MLPGRLAVRLLLFKLNQMVNFTAIPTWIEPQYHVADCGNDFDILVKDNDCVINNCAY